MESSVSDLDVLEERVEALERKLLGCAGASVSDRQQPLLQELNRLNEKVDAAIGNKEKIKELFKRLPELKRYATEMESTSIPMEAKLVLIESCAPELEKRVSELELLKASSADVLDSEHIRNAPALRPKLNAFAENQTRLNERVAKHTAEVSALLTTYNQLILSLSKQFSFWDQMLTKEEAKTISG